MLALLSAILFVIAAFAANHRELFGWGTLVWISLGFAAWVLEGVFPIAVRRK
jgi:hypothetical protein